MSNSGKVERRINRYLKNVGRALEHLEPDERREIVGGLRTHIHEGLAQRGSTPPSLEDVRSVLSSMDVPEAYRDKGVKGGFARAARHRTIGRVGFFFLLGGIGAAALSLLLGALVADALFQGGIMLSVVLGVCALGLGIAGWRDPYGKAATICAVLMLACALVSEVMLVPVSRTATGPGDPEVVIETPAETGE